MLGTILIVMLILVLLGGAVPYGTARVGPYHGYGYGWQGGGLIGLLLVIVLVLALVGHI